MFLKNNVSDCFSKYFVPRFDVKFVQGFRTTFLEARVREKLTECVLKTSWKIYILLVTPHPSHPACTHTHIQFAN